MTDSAIEAYLEKEVINGERTVTYRLLSRRLSVHVNAAKNALSAFYTRRRENNEPIYATFWLSGEPHDQAANGSRDEMEVDGDSGKDWLTRKVFIVGEEDLENAKAAFKHIHALHVYSLSIAPLESPSLLCEPSREVRELDKAGGDGLARTVGKLVSSQVKRGALPKTISKPVVAATAPPTPSVAPSTSKPAAKKETVQQKLKPSQSLSSVKAGDPKGTGKLSWAKAKPKVISEVSSTTDKVVKAEVPKKEQTVGSISGEKRGTKRKSDVISQAIKQEESVGEPKVHPENNSGSRRGSTSADTMNTARIKKGVVLSEDEDDTEKPAVKAKNSMKFRAKDLDESDTEQSVRAMMDIDDSCVNKASKPTPVVSHEEDEEEPPQTDHVDSAMDEDSDDPALKPKPKPRKTKEKKHIPIGRNGLRKRRVVKSITKLDEKKIYMVTVDYSSYESVDEEEEPPEQQKPRTKSKPAAKTKSSSRKKDGAHATDSDAPVGQTENRVPTKVEAKKPVMKKPVVKPAKERQANGSQKSLASFFGGPGGGKAKKA